MTKRVASHRPYGVNTYVPGAQYAADLHLGGLNLFTLGTPAVASATALDTDIDADGAVGLVTTQDWTADSPYGRTLTMSMDADPGAAGGVYDVYGFDYLGQPMTERFTHVNGSTAVIYGKKAFYRVYKVVNVTAATNATTVNLGTGLRLGLPYKGFVTYARENGVIVPVYNNVITLRTFFSDADFTAGCSHFLRSPCSGYIETLRGIPDGAGSTNDPVVTVELGGVAVTGLTVTVDTSDATGLIVEDAPTTAGYNANNRLIKGSVIEIVSAAAASAGSGMVEVDIVPTHFTHPVVTDPQTTTTGDPRGTYEGQTVFDGVKEYIVGLQVQGSVNSSGNGGIYGIAQV